MDRTITVLGAGAWGTAIAQLLAYNGYRVILWCFEEKVAQDIATLHVNTAYLPEVELHGAIEVTTDIAYAIGQSRWVFEAIPTMHLRSVLEHSKHFISHDHVWVILSKGVEQGSFKLPATILEDVFGISVPYVVLAGPSFASEVVAHKLTAVSLASNNYACALQCAQLLNHETFTTHLSDDVIGVQVGGAFKNVIALATGIAQGRGWGENARAYLLTLGLEEMGRLSVIYGGKAATTYGLSGLGDMLLTCTGSLSKNLRIGKMLGSGETLSQLKATGMVLPEGINTVQSLHQCARINGFQSRIVTAVYAFIFDGDRDSFEQVLWHPRE